MSNDDKALMLMAYLYGYIVDMEDINGLTRGIMPGSEVRSAIARLTDRKLVDARKRGYYYKPGFTIARGQLMRQLRRLTQPENRDLFNQIRRAVARRRDMKLVSADVAYALRLLSPDENDAKYMSFKVYGNFWYELSCVLFDEEFRPAFFKLNDRDMVDCLLSFLSSALYQDSQIDWQYLRQLVIDDRRQKRKTTATARLQTTFNFFYYLATGQMCIDIEKMPADIFALLTVALRSLFKGDYADAGKLFLKAMTLHNKSSHDKATFSHVVVNYLYELALLLDDSDTAQRRLDTFAKKDTINYTPYGSLLLKPIYSFFRKHSSPDTSSMLLDNEMKKADNESLKWLTWMVYKRLDIWPSKVAAPSLSAHQPQWAWLRNELSEMGVVPASDDAGKLLGGSVFCRLKVKPLWELTLEEIISSNTDRPETEPEERDTRLVYLLEYEMVVPLLQKKRKDGSWSIGRRLTASALKHLSEDDVHLDDNDKRLMKSLSDWDYNIFVSTALGPLSGCDHVFTGSQGDLIPVSVHEDKPFLIIDKAKDGSFTISTNVEQLAQVNTLKVLYNKNSDTDYSVYNPSDFERKLYAQILARKTYPAEAEPLLMKLIATLGGKTEIHSNMVVELDDLEKVEGETRLTLRCVPDRYDTYNISVSVHAFPGLAFAPGQGNITTIAEREGRKVQVVRHMRVERRNLKLLAQKLADIGAIEEDGDYRPETTTETLQMGISPFLDLMQWVKDNPEVCEMEWPEGARIKYHPAVRTSAASVGFKAKNGWFDVEGEVRIDDDEVISLQKLLELMHDAGKSRYIKIGDAEYITLSSDLSKILRRLDTVTTDRRNHLQMASAAAGLIGDVLDNAELDVRRSKALDDLRHRIEVSSKEQPRIPDALQATLRDYQVDGYEWMARVTSWGAGVCLADDMGLGKTLQTIALLLAQEQDGPSLVVAPASVVPNWRNELARFSPSLNVTILNSAEDREATISEAQAGDVVVSTYALLNIQQAQLAEKEWNVVCLDEAHTIKNPNTKMSRAAMTLQARRKVILTGTPIQNHLSELWNLFQFINSGLLGSAEQFARKYIEPIEGNHDKERQNQLRRLISPFLLRRTKGEVIEELPDKDEITVPVELSPDEMTMYEVRRRMAEDAVREDKTVKVSTLAEITKLRQMACSASLVDKKWKKPSSKVMAFIDLAENLNDSGNRALVFSQFTSFLAQVRSAMEKAELPYLYLDGSTPMGQREKIVRDFQTGKCPFFLISLKAGGLGLNLTGANYVIHLDPWWNPAIEQQATDRAYRIGQKQNVTVYHLISQHTIEEKILRLHKTKRDLADSLLEGTDMSHALTQEELLELLK